MIFDLNFLKAIKFALKLISMNRPAPNLQLGFGTKYDVGSCIQQYFLSSPGTTVPRNQIKDPLVLIFCNVLLYFFGNYG